MCFYLLSLYLSIVQYQMQYNVAPPASSYISRPDFVVENKNLHEIRRNDIVFLPYFQKNPNSNWETRWGEFLNYTPTDVTQRWQPMFQFQGIDSIQGMRALRVVEFVQTQNISDLKTRPNNTRIICELLTANKLRTSERVKKYCTENSLILTEAAIKIMTKQNSDTLQEFTNQLCFSRPSASEPIQNFLVHHKEYIPGVENTQLLAISKEYPLTLSECPLLIKEWDFSRCLAAKNQNHFFTQQQHEFENMKLDEMQAHLCEQEMHDQNMDPTWSSYDVAYRCLPKMRN